MIDKITPRPDEQLAKQLSDDGIENVEIFVTDKNTYASCFVNAEKPEYLVIEDDFKNGRSPLENAGIYLTDRKTVDSAGKMKVCTCLNSLHTALAVFGCVLQYKKISDEMLDKQLCDLVNALAYKEGLPVCANPFVINPEQFLQEILQSRLTNPFMPDTPQRIACDTRKKWQFVLAK